MHFNPLIPVVLTAWNLATFALMNADKRRAKRNRRRISERTLFFCAFLLGGIGIFCGMYVFHHKTRHLSFKILVPAAILADAALLYLAAGLR